LKKNLQTTTDISSNSNKNTLSVNHPVGANIYFRDNTTGQNITTVNRTKTSSNEIREKSKKSSANINNINLSVYGSNTLKKK